jgi:dipeptidase E
MRLYLSSFELGNQPSRLTSLAGRRKRVALILNALDNRRDARDKWLASQTEALTRLGFIVEELDLRNYFTRKGNLKEVLRRKDAVWINGGNAFLLRRAMRQSGFDLEIHELLRTDEVVYAGFSAAVCCAAPTLRGAEAVDDPNAVAEKYDSEIVWDGLGLIGYNVAVHYRSDHSESADVEREIQYYQDHNISYETLRDGQVIIVDGDKTETVS